MNKNITIGFIILVVLIGGYFVFSDKKRSQEGVLQKSEKTQYSTVPDFSLKDYEGNIVTPNDFPGKILVINSWAVWCPFCVDELPDFRELQEEFLDDIVVIAIDRDEPLKKTKAYTDAGGLTDTMIFLLDPGDSFYQSIGGFSMPETIFVDADGNIRVHKRGPMRLEEMREKVNSIL